MQTKISCVYLIMSLPWRAMENKPIQRCYDSHKKSLSYRQERRAIFIHTRSKNQVRNVRYAHGPSLSRSRPLSYQAAPKAARYTTYPPSTDKGTVRNPPCLHTHPYHTPCPKRDAPREMDTPPASRHASSSLSPLPRPSLAKWV